MAAPSNIKKPQDRKAKAGAKKDVPDAFSFEYDGETTTLAPTAENITPGFLRRNRSNSAGEIVYAALELVADEDQLELIDGMSWPENRRVLSDFDQYISDFFEVSLGE